MLNATWKDALQIAKKGVPWKLLASSTLSLCCSIWFPQNPISAIDWSYYVGLIGTNSLDLNTCTKRCSTNKLTNRWRTIICITRQSTTLAMSEFNTRKYDRLEKAPLFWPLVLDLVDLHPFIHVPFILKYKAPMRFNFDQQEVLYVLTKSTGRLVLTTHHLTSTLPPTIRCFWWQSASHCLPTKGRLC